MEGGTGNFEIYEWEVWHTYTSHFTAHGLDLDFAARRLVESEVALCAVHRDGRMYWRSGRDVGSGMAVIEREEYEDQAEFHFKPDAGCRVPLRGFPAESWAQACKFRFSERRVFGDDRPLPPPYVRAFLGQCNMVSYGESPFSIRLYPVLLIYESGVLVLELRLIGPDTPMSIEQFILGAENLYRQSFDLIEVPPGLSKLATRAYYHRIVRPSLLRRAAVVWGERRHDVAVTQLTRSHKEGDFTYDLAPLSPPSIEVPRENLSGFALTIFETAGFVLSRPRSGLAFVLAGQKQSPELGSFWSGRPHIYLTRFKDQCDTASENQKRHSEAFRAIMTRVPAAAGTDAKFQLPEDSRMFEDFNAFIGLAASLWVWSKRGIEQQARWKDPNRGHLVYEHQAVVEFLEYVYMLHRALLAQVDDYRSPEEVTNAQKDILNLRLQIEEASNFGEIRELLENGLRELRLPQVREHIQEALRVRDSETRAFEARSSVRIRQALTILFGLIALPGWATHVVQPLWELLPVWRPPNANLFALTSDGASLVMVGIAVMLLIKWLGPG